MAGALNIQPLGARKQIPTFPSSSPFYPNDQKIYLFKFMDPVGIETQPVRILKFK